jgi:hypothetical protein
MLVFVFHLLGQSSVTGSDAPPDFSFAPALFFDNLNLSRLPGRRAILHGVSSVARPGKRESSCYELVPKPEPAGFPENGGHGRSG